MLGTPAQLVYRNMPRPYVLEAAAHAGLDVGASEGSHLSELLGDLDGLVKQEAQLPLVTRVSR